jgi:HNH endonuclease
MGRRKNIVIGTSISLWLMLSFAPFICTTHIQIFAQSQTTTTEQPTDSWLIIFLIFVGLVAVIWWKLKHRGGKYRQRRYFQESVKKETLRNQNYKCAICKRTTGVWDYDHIDGNRSHNDPNNCQALCPNCHAKKTRGLLRQEQKSHFLRRLGIGIVIFIIIIAIMNYYKAKIFLVTNMILKEMVLM